MGGSEGRCRFLGMFLGDVRVLGVPCLVWSFFPLVGVRSCEYIHDSDAHDGVVVSFKFLPAKLELALSFQLFI